MKTRNPFALLADIHTSIRYGKGIIELMKAENNALMTYYHWRGTGNQRMINRSWDKYQKLVKLVNDYPDPPEPINFIKD